MSSIELKRLLESAEASLRLNPDYELGPQERWAVLRALYSDNTPTPYGTRGARRLVYSELLSVERVLPIWEAWRPGNFTPHACMIEANGFLAGTWDLDHAAQVLRENPDEYLDDPPYFVFPAALHLLQVAILSMTSPDQLFSFDYNDHTISTNRELEYAHGWDSCFCASVAHAGGVSWVPGSDKKKRMDFWIWWIKENVPKAEATL